MNILTLFAISICLTIFPIFILLFSISWEMAKRDPKVIASKNRGDREIAVLEWKLKKKIQRLNREAAQ